MNRRNTVVVFWTAVMALTGLALVLTLVSATANAQPIADRFISSSIVAHSSSSAPHTVSASSVITRPLVRSFPLNRAQHIDQPPDAARAPQAASGSGSLSAGMGQPAQDLWRSEPLAPPMPGSEDFAVCLNSERVWGFIGADQTAQVQINGAQMGADTATARGFFWTTLYDAGGNRPGLSTGDVVTLTHGVSAVGHTLRAIDAQMDLVSNIVSGTIGNVTAPLSLTVYLGGEPSTRAISRTANTDAAGHFVVDFTEVWDLNAFDMVAVAYHENGWEVHRHIAPAHSLAAFPAPWSMAEGLAAPNSVVTLTAYLADGVTVKELITTTAQSNDVNSAYYSADFANLLSPGDIVAAHFADGMVLTRTMMALSLNLDVVNDRLTGQTAPGTVLQGMSSALFPQGRQSVIVSTTATASGYYTVNFSGKMDLLPGTWAGIVASDAAGNDVQSWRPSPYIEVNQTWDDVSGRGSYMPVDAAGRTVTLTVYSAASHATSTYVGMLNTNDFYQFNNNAFNMPDIQPGDVLTVTDGVWTGSVRVTMNTVQANTQLDQITGSIVPPSDQVEVTGSYIGDYLYPLNGSFDLPVTATPFFTLTPGGFDLTDNVTYGAFHRTSAGYMDWRSRETGGFGVFPWWNGVEANLGDPNVPYTITLYDNGGAFKGRLTGTSQYPNGNANWRSFWDVNQQMQIGDRVQVQAANGYSRSITLPHVTLDYDALNRVIYGQAPPNVRLYATVDDYGSGFIPTDDSGQYRVAINQLQDVYNRRAISWGDSWHIQYIDPNGTWLYYQYEWPQIIARYSRGGSNDVWGNIGLPGNTIAVTITRPNASVVFTGTTTTGTCNWCGARGYQINVPDNTILPNDRVTVDFGDGFIDTMRVLTITGSANAATDIFTINAPPGTAINANANSPMNHWDSSWNHNEVIVGASGIVTFNLGLEGFDIVPDTDFNIHSQQLHGHNTQYSFRMPRNAIDVAYAHDWAYVNTAPNTPVTLTWRSALGGLATYVGQTNPQGELYTDGAYWNPPYPDIQPGDAVTVTGPGLLAVVNPIGMVNGTLNLAADTVSGTIHAPFGSTPLVVFCEVWVNNGPPRIMIENVPANGGSYFCDFSSTWDIVPGQDVAVRYVEPDGDTVINIFEGPEPDVRIEKWPEGGGASNGLAVFTIRYRNDGKAVAQNVLITDTLPASTSYYTDSSKLPRLVSGGQVVWSAGTLQPGEVKSFQVVLDVSAGPGSTLLNQADISTSSLGDPTHNNHAEAQANVGGAMEADLWINKWSNPDNPAPGQTFNYRIDYGNNFAAGARGIWITDTLPPSTTLVSWSSQNGYSLWTAVITTGGKMVLYAPVLPGNFGDQIVLTLRLDAHATYGTQLSNTVEITGTPDGIPDNNQAHHTATWVSPARYQVSLNKNWGHGALIPGQHVYYWLNFSNNGNMPAPNVVVTDVLPAGLTFVAAMRNLGQGIEVPYPPPSITGRMLRWDVGSMAIGEYRDVRIELAISPALAAGTMLTNCAVITTSAPESDPYDNASCVMDTVRPVGSNLRVRTHPNWNNPNRVRYDVEIGNIGSQNIQNVHVTATLPVSMSIGWWGLDFWNQWSSNLSGNQIALTLERLEPYSTAWLHIDADVPNVPNGTLFTTTARIDIPPGDVYPQDNTSTSVIGTGPDLTIAKWQSGGVAKAGQLLTYTLHFKNDSQWWTQGNVRVTDTLPAGTQFVAALQRDCGDMLFCDKPPTTVSGRTLTWDYDQWGRWWWNDLIVTVRVTNTLAVGAILTNTAAIATDQYAADREPNYANNLAVSAVQLPVYKVYLPLIKK